MSFLLIHIVSAVATLFYGIMCSLIYLKVIFVKYCTIAYLVCWKLQTTTVSILPCSLSVSCALLAT